MIKNVDKLTNCVAVFIAWWMKRIINIKFKTSSVQLIFQVRYLLIEMRRLQWRI